MGDFHIEEADPLALWIPTVYRGFRRKLQRRRDWKDLDKALTVAERIARIERTQADSSTQEKA